MPGMQHKFQISLLRPGGQSGGRAGSLAHDDEDRCFGHARQADPFRH